METSQGREKSASYSELNFSRVCLGHERHVFKDIFCLSSPGWYSWPNAALEPHVYSGNHEIPRWIIQEDFCESNFVKSLNFRNKLLSKLFRLRCQFFPPFSLSPFLPFSLSFPRTLFQYFLPQNSISDTWRFIPLKQLLMYLHVTYWAPTIHQALF